MAKKQTKKKKKITFSKLIVLWVIILTTLCVCSSYILSAFDKQTVESLAGIMVTSMSATIVTYCVKSLGEKASRNKYKVDENGNPISDNNSNNI